MLSMLRSVDLSSLMGTLGVLVAAANALAIVAGILALGRSAVEAAHRFRSFGSSTPGGLA